MDASRGMPTSSPQMCEMLLVIEQGGGEALLTYTGQVIRYLIAD